ncbi:MAG TPA: FHA domain-containing protein [Methanoregulaceae archaeon]|nr:FHA domain-containing protein [Methanoregulaceae archaeon]
MEEKGTDRSETIVLSESDDYYVELSEYLEVLSNSQRLKILKILEKSPKEVRKIAAEIDTSYENTKKHLDKLLSTGLIRKEAGLGQATSKGVHPVWKYSLVPGAMEAIVRNLGLFSNIRINPVDPELRTKLDAVRGQVAEELLAPAPSLVLLGGPEDGKVFLLSGHEIRVGRIDPKHPGSGDPSGDVILSADYTAVSRISKPHGKLINENGQWFIEDGGSTGGTMVNSATVTADKRIPLQDGDLIELAKGIYGAKLLVIMPAQA